MFIQICTCLQTFINLFHHQKREKLAKKIMKRLLQKEKRFHVDLFFLCQHKNIIIVKPT